MPPVVLKDTKKNPTHAEVDDQVLVRGGDAVELTDDQIARLKSLKLSLEISGNDDSSSEGTTQNPGQTSLGGVN